MRRIRAAHQGDILQEQLKRDACFNFRIVFGDPAQFQHVGPAIQISPGFAAQFRTIAAFLGDSIEQLWQRQFIQGIGEVGHQAPEFSQGIFGGSPQRGMQLHLLYSLVERHAFFCCPLLQVTNCFRADFAIGHIDDTFEA